MSTNNTKVQKEYPDFAQEVELLDGAALRQRIVVLQQSLEESEACKEADEALTTARATALELGAPYRDVKKAVRLKTRYLIELLKSRG